MAVKKQPRPAANHAPTCASPDQCNGRCLWTVPDYRELFGIYPRKAETIEELWDEL